MSLDDFSVADAYKIGSYLWMYLGHQQNRPSDLSLIMIGYLVFLNYYR